ncbi:MAG: hypothetical protein KA604_01780 [Candidatus Saccharimonas sp.]|nr:hypothetical protein [Candidatus Saccharimonas sp.]
MDKQAIQLSIKRVFTDRPFLFLMAGLVLTSIIYMIVLGVNIHPSDVTVYNRYTAFGEAHFYKAHWQYLLSFVIFGVMTAAIHLSLMIKFHNLDRRQTALLVGWLGIIILMIAFTYALAVMQLGRST